MKKPRDKPRDTAIPSEMPTTRGYQQEMLEESLRCNIIIALDTGSGKTHIAVLRMKIEVEREPTKISWFVAPTVALCEQQRAVIQASIPVSVGLVSGSMEPIQWKNPDLWTKVLVTHRIMVSTPQVLLDALRHGYIVLGRDISLLIFDEAHHAVDNHPYNRIMQEFYFDLPFRLPNSIIDNMRPYVLGLTASPIYGGNVEKAFKTIEGNLDCIIRAPRHNKTELAKFVHRPTFRHVQYNASDPSDPPFSTNHAAVVSILHTLDIESDPYVKSLRQQLAKAPPRSAEYQRVDQKLSKVILKQDSFTHKGLRDFERTASAICGDLGGWAADWYVSKVIQQAKRAANPYNNIISTWKNSEKQYLLSIINQIVVSPVSMYPNDVADDSSDKIRVLVEILLSEKLDAEAENESYSGIVFVERRDAALALTEVLRHHPSTKDTFRFGCLLGSSDTSRRHSFLDITRTLLTEKQEDTLMDFKIGEKNVIISTAVAEEGIDIQLCGSVIRWDPPLNMASWAQSRGRARRQRSTYTLMFEKGGAGQENVRKWENLEKEMTALYNDPSRELPGVDDDQDPLEDDGDAIEFRIESTGALLTLHSAVSHLSHFCAVIPTTTHVDNRPLYDIDPPEIPEGWHSFANGSKEKIIPYTGPFGSKVTLPRSLPLPNRVFSTERLYKTKITAHRHAAFIAYRALYDAELLNEHLLPTTSVVEPHLEEEVKEMLKDVEKRASTANVSIQMDPWVPLKDSAGCWFSYELIIGGLPPLQLFIRSQKFSLPGDKGPTLYRPGQEPVQVWLRFVETIPLSDGKISRAKEYTRMLFWSLNGQRMTWDKLEFSYLVFPANPVNAQWGIRQTWFHQINETLGQPEEYLANAEKLGKRLSYPTDLGIIRNGFQFSKAYRFVRWRYEQLTPEEELEFREYYSRFSDLEISYPLLIVQPLPTRTNFLIPTPPPPDEMTTPPKPKSLSLLPRISAVVLLSKTEIEYAFLLPSIFRSLSMTLTALSLRDSMFASSPIHTLPLSLLVTAVTAPVSQEKYNYQRLETLGDTVLKFVVGIQLVAEYPLWHEGYLTKRKDHAVSNVRLAKENIARGLYRWIIRDRMLGRKWKPAYLPGVEKDMAVQAPLPVNFPTGIGPEKRPKQQELSTKVLADVVESLIGAAYLHGGFDLGYECAKFFGLGMKWQPLSARVEALLSRVEERDNMPSQFADVERMLGYSFKRKLLLMEALTHATYEQNQFTPSYERMEFLGDSVLDMVVTDFLYHAPGKNYSPGHMHLRKSALVNAHFLAFICLRCSAEIDAAMPGPNAEGRIEVQPNTHLLFLWQCLLHSSPRILDDQVNTSARYRRGCAEIEDALQNGTIFPWAALTRLQAPKFFSDMVESLIGAVYVDSKGDLDTVRGVLRSFGIMQVLEHVVNDGVDVHHPVSRLSVWASKHEKEVEYVFYKEKGTVSCAILMDEKEEVRCTELYRGHASQEEVKFMAAEMAIKMFRLRDVNMNYMDMKGKKGIVRKKNKKSLQEGDPKKGSVIFG